jgi:hypothetical protein
LGSSVSAADVGLGVSAKSDDAWIYLPIDVSPKLRIEPSVRYTEGESESTSQLRDLPPTVSSSEAHSLEVGVGLFGLTAPLESVRVYYGARVAYIDSENEFKSTGVFDEIVGESSSDGYRIAPTVGFEYQFNRHFTIGGEAVWYYEKLEGDDTRNETTFTFDVDRTGTDTHLILRYFF